MTVPTPGIRVRVKTVHPSRLKGEQAARRASSRLVVGTLGVVSVVEGIRAGGAEASEEVVEIHGVMVLSFGTVQARLERYPPAVSGALLQRLRVTDSTMTPNPSAEPTKVSFAGFLAAVLHVDDPRERLRRLATIEEGLEDLRGRIRRVRRNAILEIRSREPLCTWTEIGELLGVSGQRAEQISREP